MMNLKWIFSDDVSLRRGNYRPLIAKYDNSKCWLSIPAFTTTYNAKRLFRELGQMYSSSQVEVKYLYDDEDRQTETNVVEFLKMPDGTFIFRNELNVPGETKRQYEKYDESKIFTSIDISKGLDR